MLLPILKWPDPRLKKVSALVVPDELPPFLVADMEATLAASAGLALAAIQVGVALRLVVTVFPGLEVLINPRIVAHQRRRRLCSEGCLSLPGYVESVPRWPEVVLEFQRMSSMDVHQVVLHDLKAQCCQHELEHLDGKFFLDHVAPGRRDRIRAELRKGSRYSGSK